MEINSFFKPMVAAPLEPANWDMLSKVATERTNAQKEGLQALSGSVTGIAGVKTVGKDTDKLNNQILPAVQEVAKKYLNADWNNPVTRYNAQQDLEKAAPSKVLAQFKQNSEKWDNYTKNRDELAAKGQWDRRNNTRPLDVWNKSQDDTFDPVAMMNVDHTDKLFTKYYSKLEPTQVKDADNNPITDRSGYNQVAIDDKTLRGIAEASLQNEKGSTSYNDIVSKVREDNPGLKDMTDDQIYVNQLYNVSKQKLVQREDKINAVQAEQRREWLRNKHLSEQ